MNQYNNEINPYVLKKYANVKSFGGSGVRVGIVTASCYEGAKHDLELFCREYNIPYSSPVFHYISKNKKPLGVTWLKETATALQYIRAFAPGCEQFVYSTGSDRFSDLFFAAQKAAQECDIICLNFGVPEWSGQKEYSGFFQNSGKLFVCAAGNNRSVTFPASCKNVVSVGGVYADFSGKESIISNEKFSEKSGAGCSLFEEAPVWQKDFYGHKIFKRAVPDISFFAYGKTEASIFFGGKKDMVSGTSLASSCIAGICALIDSFSPVFSEKKAEFFFDIAQKSPQSFRKISPEKENFLFGGLGVPNIHEILKNM